MPTIRTSLRPPVLATVFVGCLAAGVACASRQAKTSAVESAPREKDTAPERKAALPGVDRESEPENIERRYGREAARERQEMEQRERAGQPGTSARGEVLVPEGQPGAKKTTPPPPAPPAAPAPNPPGGTP